MELGLIQLLATKLFKDKTAAIVVTNAKHPEDKTQHITIIQHFTLQTWAANAEVIIYHTI
jgi:hypothetical protein